MEAQGLLVPSDGDINGRNGYRVLSRRAEGFEDESQFLTYAVARRLPLEVLHERIRKPVWLAYMRGDFDNAVMQAMKAVEIAVREASGFSDLVGVKLMRSAFNPENGVLADKDVETGERQGRAELFAGAMAAFRNPHAHRKVDLKDPVEALEIILLANHLLRVVDGAAKR